MPDEDDDEHGHDHGELRYLGVDVDDATLATLRVGHPELARNLESCRRFAELSETEKAELGAAQEKVERADAWIPGYHAPGDQCVACGKPTIALFTDRFEQGALPYAAFLGGLPVHPTEACLAKAPRGMAPRALDQAKRACMRDLNRPSPGMTQFFRHDALTQPPFGLEDWANSVSDANPKGLDRPTQKDIERLLHWVHHRMFHG